MTEQKKAGKASVIKKDNSKLLPIWKGVLIKRKDGTFDTGLTKNLDRLKESLSEGDLIHWVSEDSDTYDAVLAHMFVVRKMDKNAKESLSDSGKTENPEQYLKNLTFISKGIKRE